MPPVPSFKDDYDLKYLFHHIFFPPRLPQADDSSPKHDHDICRVVHDAAKDFQRHLSFIEMSSWTHILAMLQRFCDLYKPHRDYTQDELTECISDMSIGDVTAFLVRAQNAGLLIRKLQDRTIFESFEATAPNAKIMSTSGKLVCSFPGPSISVPASKATDHDFISALTDFLTQMNKTVNEEAMPTTKKAGTQATEIRDSPHPRFITELLTGILRGIGHPEEGQRLTKRIADDVLWDNTLLPWRRSPLWLVIRVALQTSLRDPTTGSHTMYKSFMAFLMSRLVRMATDASFDSDSLSIMHMKLARRVYKIRGASPSFLLDEVSAAGEIAQMKMKQRWEQAQEEDKIGGLKGWDPSRLNWLGDTTLSLDNSKAYILKVLEGSHQARSSAEFNPSEASRLKTLEEYTADNFSNVLQKFRGLALLDFERAVEEGIDGWVSKRLTSEAACWTVWKWIEAYHSHAESNYGGNPEEMSMMYMTLLDLWIGLDKLCTAQCPLLLDYSPELVEGIFQPLLLRRSESVERLKLAIQYLRVRHSRAIYSNGIFCKTINSSSFSVRFFASSSGGHLRSLKDRIERQARNDRQRKEEELQRENKRYSDLVRKEGLLSHEYRTNWRNGRQYHDGQCEKCRLEREYTNMKITVFEWPLPSRTEEAEATVLEIACPKFFSVWRQATYHILINVCTPSRFYPSSSSVELEISGYSGLSGYIVHDSIRRLTFASSTKSWSKTHYRGVALPTTTDKVCLSNGLKLALFDSSKKAWVDQPFSNCNIESKCTYQLPSAGAYYNLQWTVDSTRHTSNQVLANQSECHRELGLHEYVAFGSLRAGERLQWANVLRELHARTLTFSQSAVEMLVSQAALQMGPLTKGISGTAPEWEWHTELYSHDFHLHLVDELKDLLQSISRNWSEVGTMRIVVLLSRCILNWSRGVGNDVPEACQRALEILRDCRRVAYRWMKDVGEKLQAASGSSEDIIKDFQRRLCEIAATCRSTCDVGLRWYQQACSDDPSHQSGEGSDSDLPRFTLSIILEAGMILRDNMPHEVTEFGASVRHLFVRDARFSHSFEQFLVNAVLTSNDVLHDAVSRYWPTYSRTSESRWRRIPAPNDRWLYLEGGTQLVHFNVLSSQLLVDGKPLGRLPSNFVSHSTYKRIFGQAILDVIPADRSEPGAEFATNDRIKVEDDAELGYQVFFAYKSGELIVKATLPPSRRINQVRRYELIPHTILFGDLPHFLVEDYAHWLSLDDGVIEIRPLNDIWNTRPANWRIVLGKDGRSSPYMYRRSTPRAQLQRLVDVRSLTASMLTSRLLPLEKREFMTITHCDTGSDKVIEVDLPRYRLSFQLTSTGEFLCTTLPNMAVDDNQYAGIMIGLINKLVLRNTKCDGRRELLLPLGKASFSQPQSKWHTEVRIDVGTHRRVSYYRYVIDDLLGRLVGNTNLHARFYKLYLIALTSSCLPDPLTGRTGTHEALIELNSASCRSFITLEDQAQKLLHKIAELTPRRVYYPSHLQAMQTVQWRDLPSLVQHDGFYAASHAILQFASRLNVFATEQSPRAVKDLEDLPAELLVKRAAARHMWFSPSELHVQRPYDAVYRSRDVPNESAENVICTNSALVNSWPAKLPTTSNLLQKLKEWSAVVPELAGPSGEMLMIPYMKLKRPIALIWLTLYNHLRSNSTNRYQVLFTLCSLGYYSGLSDIQSFIPTLLAFATNRNRFFNLNPPQWESYILSEGFEPTKASLLREAKSSGKEFAYDDYSREVPALSNEYYCDTYSRRRAYYEKQLEREADEVVGSVADQWPCLKPSAPRRAPDTIRIDKFISKVEPMFACWYRNRDLLIHVESVQRALDVARAPISQLTVDAYTFDPCHRLTARPPSSLSLHDLFTTSRAPLDSLPSLLDTIPSDVAYTTQNSPSARVHQDANDRSKLGSLADELRRSDQQVHRTYAKDLSQSLNALRSAPSEAKGVICTRFVIPVLHKYRQECETHFRECFEAIQCALGPSFETETKSENHAGLILQQANLWPTLEPRPVLQSIVSTNSFMMGMPAEWTDALCHAVRSLILLQRSLRLLRMAQLGKNDDLEKEVDVDSSVLMVANCDWLLIQVENDFLVRKVQLAVAEEMASPSTGESTLLQLNMGEGKSSVIVPLVSTAVADGKKLLRVVVLKSLATQMFSLLQQRLGGLVNRQILYFPFSRDVKIGSTEAEHLQRLYEYAVASRAILVAQPEHLLSFKLMAINQLVERDGLSRQLIRTQLWLDDRARDVLDESDEILHTRYQLIYTVGAQQTLELGSDRWTTIQELLSFVKEQALHIQKSHPHGLEVGNSDNRFPLIRVLKREAGEKLVSGVLEMVMESRMSTCDFERFPCHMQRIAKRFISNETLSGDEMRALEDEFGPTLWKKLLLLRGLLGQGILLYVLQNRRWRVDFGLDLTRTLLAVPYRAKDVPSLRAEFGHPDVAILLTCLSYLYGGLLRSDLNATFGLLFKLDNPKLEYERWVRTASNVPANFRDVSGINLKDSGQLRDVIFPLFRSNPATIDFYLSRVVFPKAAKEFQQKLTTTGWDLACQKRHVTTGFSGTNDNRHLLPTSITQVDTPDRLATNAHMLSVLLDPRNDHYMRLSTRVVSGKEIVNAMVTTEGSDIRVLLDVGAQILGMSNVEVASYWLRQRLDLEAAVFFNEQDSLEVITRDGTRELLGLSPFNDNFEKCLVYLDDAHTRGTDLKLPTNWKACVTLGPKVTKDRLAQGCMRMRKLGRGQTVVYMAPRDIDSAILERAKKSDNDVIHSCDVIRWAMLETCAEIKHHVPHWVQQGVDFTARDEGWKKLAIVSEDPLQAVDTIKSSWLRPEARTLQEMYGNSSQTGDNSLTELARATPQIWKRCEALGVTEIRDPHVEEEQEREVSHEIEREPQIERPPKAQPRLHDLHPDVERFIKTGIIPTHSDAFDDVFPPLIASAGSTDILRWNAPIGLRLLATQDFLNSIQSSLSISPADYLRPVNWVVFSDQTRSLVILSPFEVNKLLPTIRRSEKVQLHIYTPRVTQFMRPVDDLKFYSFRPLSVAWAGPEPRVVDQLNLCAGQLYFSDHETYRRISAFLGVRIREDPEMKSEGDGFVKPRNRTGRLESDCCFDSSPLPYLKVLIGARRKGITFEPTHMGKILQGRYLDFGK